MKRLQKKFDTVTLHSITIEPHEEGGYFASCPLFQGCHAEGKTVGKAVDNIRDVIRVYIEARKKFRESVPSVEIPEVTKLRFTMPVPISS